MYQTQYYNPGYAAAAPQPTQQTPPPTQGSFQWVKSVDEVNDYLMAPNTSAMFFDSNAKCFYVKTVDSLGMAQPLRIFDYKERVSAQPTNDFVTREELEKRLSELTKKEEAKDELSL